MSFKILIVEDDPRSRKLLADLLAIKGYEVLEAQNGLEGIQQARAALPDLILMDIQMPKLDGFEAVKMLKAEALTQAIPVWALTSYAMKEDAARIRQQGCDLCLTKPFDVVGLLQRIEACANSRVPGQAAGDGGPAPKGAL